MAVVDSREYAERLRRSLMQDLFQGEDLGTPVDGMEDYSFGEPGDPTGLADLEKEIEAYQDHEIIREIMDQGKIVKEYAKEVDEKLRAVEMDSIQDYIQESDNLVLLHDQIKDCDAILMNMEDMLGRFQLDLGKVSDEIRQLQVQSQSMSVRLKNRKLAESKLGTFIEQVSVSDELVLGISQSEVDEDYLDHLLTLDHKLRFSSQDEVARTSQARKDMDPVLENLRIAAVAKIREFLLQKMYTLKKPKTNIQIIQQNVLLKYKYCIRFLASHGEDIYDEIRTEYISLLSKILSSHFRTYLTAMEKLYQVAATQVDVIGVPEATSNSVNVLSLFTKDRARSATEQVFELGKRTSVLGQTDKPAIIPHMAEFDGKKFSYEVVFRNIHKLLLDTATSEYCFCLDFFEDENIFKDLFAPIVAVVETDLSTAVQDLYDIVAILLMIRVNQEHRLIMAKRRVPCLDDYLDRIHILLWPRFKVLFDAQLASLKGGHERQLFNNEPGVHSVAKRYATLTASMLQLMSDQDHEEGVFQASSFQEIMDRLWAAIFDMLLRMSNMFKERRKGIIFLIVNYKYILDTLRAGDLSALAGSASTGLASPTSPRISGGGGLGKAGATAIRECEDQLSTCTGLYVEDQLQLHFQDLIQFVKKAEQSQRRLAVQEGSQIPGYTPGQAGPILRDFSSRWTSAIELMNKEVVRQFTDNPCGRDVLQASMTQLLLYYTRFLELLKRQGPEGLALAKDAVNIPSIMYEIKKITKG